MEEPKAVLWQLRLGIELHQIQQVILSDRRHFTEIGNPIRHSIEGLMRKRKGQLIQAVSSLTAEFHPQRFIVRLQVLDLFLLSLLVLCAAHHHLAQFQTHLPRLLQKVQLDLYAATVLHLDLLGFLADVVIEIFYPFEDGLIVGFKICQLEAAPVLGGSIVLFAVDIKGLRS